MVGGTSFLLAPLGSPSLSLGPQGLPTTRCLSRRSPLRSVDCTAAPEGQTKFGFGKRSQGAILEIRIPCTDCGKSPQPRMPRAWPRSTRRHPPDGRYARGQTLKSRGLGGGGPSGRERVLEAKPAPGLSLIAQISENPAPRHRPPSSKGAGEDSGGDRIPAERESQLDSKPSRSHPKSFRQRFLFPTFYFPNPILPTSQTNGLQKMHNSSL